jgi:putative flippase GtrA
MLLPPQGDCVNVNPWTMPSGFLNFRGVPLALRKGSVPMKAISFGLVGVVNTLADLGVFWIALKVMGLPLLLANLIAWLVAVSGSYILNCFTTFAAESGRKLALRKYAAFIASGVAGFVAGSATLVIAAMLVPILVAKLFAIAVSFALNFLLSHFVIFRPVSQFGK